MAKINFAQVATKVVSVGAGAVAGEFIATKLVPDMNPMIKGGGQMLIGAALPIIMPKAKMLAPVGDGMIANGAVTLARSFGLFGEGVNGVGNLDDMIIEEDFTSLGNAYTGDEYVGDDDTETVGNADQVAGDDSPDDFTA